MTTHLPGKPQPAPATKGGYAPDPLSVTGLIGWFHTEHKGRGVVARQPIAAGTLIEANPVIIMPAADLKNRDGQTVTIDNYIFCWETLGPDQDSGLFALPLGHISLCNHSATANAEFRQDHARNLILLYALRDIAPGEEVCIDYRIDLWFVEQE